ncbi:hypothetical protein CLU81_2120 [Flavobacterium sp. 9]|uniref:hypothetical protein n=1 Tax=Flavobacterium sp. 9 TaxID=2035198 RepID=UPI000C1A8531|nr:hypothetical protein [Flavobacterium sp. 9]PIF31617.1 hypothetical protein CLU81_2120 [Flavobacterium sp. 9]
MRKIAVILLLVLNITTSCSSDADDKASVTSSIIIDGKSFVPTKGVYFYKTASFDTQKSVNFVISNEKGETFYIDISFPASQKDLNGIYDFGPGTADKLLVSCELVTATTRYPILGYTLKITDLGNSNFSFVFTQPVAAFDVVKNKQVTFKGGLEGQFKLTEVKQ